MKFILNFFYYLGLLVGGLLFLYALVGYIALNAFELKEIQVSTFSFEKDDWIMSLQYSYIIDDKSYNKQVDMSEDLYRKHFEIGSKEISVWYNPYFPDYSYVDGLNLESHKKKTSMIVSLIFLLFINAVYWLSNRKKWIAIYSGKYDEYKKAKELNF